MSGRPTELQYVETPLLDQLQAFGWDTIRLNDTEKHDPVKSYRDSLSEVIIERELKAALLRLNSWLTDAQANDLCIQIRTYPFQMNKLLENNMEILERITGAAGLSADCEETGETNRPVRIIDWSDADRFDKDTSKNHFLAISQLKVRLPGKEEHIIPDVVLFINGLPLVVVECKAPDIADPIAEGIEQLLRYQNRRGADDEHTEGVPELFFFNQFVISTCYHSARYTSITGGASHFIEWKDPYPYKLSEIKEGGVPSSQELLVAGMLEPSHLLDIVQNYVVFIEDDEGRTIKIVPRYMQYRGARKIIERLRNGDGGTLWHTQGSGKSLTMMFVIRKMYNSSDLNSYKIVLLIDRKDLQDQLYKTSGAIRYAVNLAGSIEGLKGLIHNTASDVTVAMVHKFGDRPESVGKFPVLNESDRILVLIDEAHRSEYSELAANMWRSMPNSVKVAFTGTPITKTTETFGGYIDAYTMRQAVEDEVVVEIKYEGRATRSDITDRDAMNRDFIDIFGYMETEEQIAIMGRYTARGYLEARETINAKASDMVEHYVSSVFPNGFKAQVVGVSKEAAARYKDALEKHLAEKIAALKESNPLNIDIARLEALKVACVISSAPNDEPHLKVYGYEDQNELIIDGFKAPFGSTGKKGGNGNYGIIVVTSMLLTGFDAPVEQVMYLDKILKNHGLLQAIARVNRTSGKDKTCGYVVDYVGIANHLREALAEYDEADIEETIVTLRNVDQDIDALNSAYNNIMQFIRDRVRTPSLENAEMIIEELVADDELSEKFNVLFGNLSRIFDRVLPNPAALDYSEDFKRLSFIRESVAKRRRDPLLSMRDASKKVRAIIEDYLEINGIDVEVEPVSLLSDDFLSEADRHDRSDRAISNEIEYAVREYINVNTPRDPELYARLSEKLDEILQQFQDNWTELRTALTRLRDDIAEGRRRENTYGYEPEHEMPFFALLKKELFGDKAFADLAEDDFNALKDLTNDVLERMKRDTTTVNFWNNASLQNELRTFIINQLITSLEIRRRVPNIFVRRKEIAQRILELGYQHYRRNGE